MRERNEILASIRSDAAAKQPQGLIADILTGILEVLLDIRDSNHKTTIVPSCLCFGRVNEEPWKMRSHEPSCGWHELR